MMIQPSDAKDGLGSTRAREVRLGAGEISRVARACAMYGPSDDLLLFFSEHHAKKVQVGHGVYLHMPDADDPLSDPVIPGTIRECHAGDVFFSEIPSPPFLDLIVDLPIFVTIQFNNCFVTEKHVLPCHPLMPWK
ncbi:hypothetical protein N7532_006226 [Penicillium argentinense]|uniref:Uncharacterized protein n=1 Tax=Penicillium argentinense TaxID=1131581 RepID=A0A9W9KAN7_9EURO|nr:uncharacterized protein N7532_006226 [Penicillium argentinense]KAJ5099225.1 hypothetical protein N7532_006226 [Penicillium argentinense]